MNENPKPLTERPGKQLWGDDDGHDKEADLPLHKASVEISLPPQTDAPHVFRFECPDCKAHLSLFGRMGSYFIKTLR